MIVLVAVVMLLTLADKAVISTVTIHRGCIDKCFEICITEK